MLLEILAFLAIYLFCFILILLTMTNDNCHFITNSPEWEWPVEKIGNEVPIKDISWKEYFRYVMLNRWIPVWTQKRDRVPATVSALALTLVIYFRSWKAFLVAILLMIFSILWIVVYVKVRKVPYEP